AEHIPRLVGSAACGDVDVRRGRGLEYGRLPVGVYPRVVDELLRINGGDIDRSQSFVHKNGKIGSAKQIIPVRDLGETVPRIELNAGLSGFSAFGVDQHDT